MKNQGLKIALIVFGVVALGVGAYLVFRPKKDDKDNSELDDKKDGDVNDLPLSSFVPHIVSTKASNLNLRSIPSTSGNIIQSLPKGSEILAKPSQTEGWHEVSDDGKKVIGFVSSQFITKK